MNRSRFYLVFMIVIFGIIFSLKETYGFILDVIPLGTKVKIIKDMRLQNINSATGKIAIYDGAIKDNRWLLFSDSGQITTITALILPDDFVEWDPENSDWPKKKCAIRYETPRFKFDDCSTITGRECVWVFVEDKWYDIFRDHALEWFANAFEKIKASKRKNH